MGHEEPTVYSPEQVKANRQILIDHYSRLPNQERFLSWGYEDCAAGVLAIKGRISTRYADSEVAAALGIPLDQAIKLIYNPRNATSQRVVWSLQALVITGEFKWMDKPLEEALG